MVAEIEKIIKVIIAVLSILFLKISTCFAVDPSVIYSIYKRLEIDKLCKEMGFTKCRFIVKGENYENAWVTGDGNIYLTIALIRNCKTEDELAFIIAHELGHLYYRHPEKSIEEDFYTQLGLLVSKWLFNLDKEDIILSYKLLTAKYSREHEREADAFAVKLLLKAGYDPLKAVELFSRAIDEFNKVKEIKTQLEVIINKCYYDLNYLSGYCKTYGNYYNCCISNPLIGYICQGCCYVYNLLVQACNTKIAEYNNLMKQIAEYLNPYLRSHPLDEERITFIINTTIELKNKEKNEKEKLNKNNNEFVIFDY